MTKKGVFNPFREMLPPPKLELHLEEYDDDAPADAPQMRLDGDTHVLVLDNTGDVQSVPARLGKLFRDIYQDASNRVELRRWGVTLDEPPGTGYSMLPTPYGKLYIRLADDSPSVLDELAIYRLICRALNALPVHALLKKHGVKVIVRRS